MLHKLFLNISYLDRKLRRIIILLLDIFLISFSLFLSFKILYHETGYLDIALNAEFLFYYQLLE